MRFEIQTNNIQLTNGIRRYAERRFTFVLGRFKNRIRSVTLHLLEAKDPAAGTHKTCQIVLKLLDGERILATDSHPELRTALDGALQRACRCISRRLMNQRELYDCGFWNGPKDAA